MFVYVFVYKYVGCTCVFLYVCLSVCAFVNVRVSLNV